MRIETRLAAPALRPWARKLHSASPFAALFSSFSKLSILSAVLLHCLPAQAQSPTNTDYFGKIQTPPGSDKNGKPNTPIPDPFDSSLLKDGKTNVPLTPEAEAAQKLRESKQAAAGQFGDDTLEHDRSVHLNVVSGSYVQVLITTDHAVQLSVLRNGEVVRPTNIILGNNEFVQYVFNADSSPYIYVSAKVCPSRPNHGHVHRDPRRRADSDVRIKTNLR